MTLWNPENQYPPRAVLGLHQELFLLALDDRKGSLHPDAEPLMSYALAGGILAELLLGGRIRVDEHRRVLSFLPQASGDDLLDESLQRILAREKPRKLTFWVNELADQTKRLIRRTGMQLVEKKVLTRREHRYLWVIPHEVYPQVDVSAKFWLKRALHDQVLSGAPATQHDLALLSLARATMILELIFTSDEMKSVCHRMDHMELRDEVGPAVEEAVEWLEAAAIAAASDALLFV